MGTVYAGTHMLLGNRAAIKILSPDSSRNHESIRRFLREARATSAIEHPGIIQVFDFGCDGADTIYMVMELLHGENLRERIARRRSSVSEVRRLGMQIASALAAAHERGIIHRDLKPDNIFVVPDPAAEDGERVKVLDFGIAKLVDAGCQGLAGISNDGGCKTATGALLGTPRYMAPEQCKGGMEIDRRVDIYSLACVLFQLACGRPPFTGSSVAELIAAHLRDPVPSLHAMDRSIPPELDAVLSRAMAKDRRQRFPTMEAFSQAIDRACSPPTIDPLGVTVEVSSNGSGRADPWPLGSGSEEHPRLPGQETMSVVREAIGARAHVDDMDRGRAGFPKRVLLLAVALALASMVGVLAGMDKAEDPIQSGPPSVCSEKAAADGGLPPPMESDKSPSAGDMAPSVSDESKLPPVASPPPEIERPECPECRSPPAPESNDGQRDDEQPDEDLFLEV